jgi:predicted secreted protein|tara:strand:- start:2085 stop:2492 length:408 start_codon:yes stop_codon:yes gene_type:complete
MASLVGNAGVINVNSQAVAEVRSYSIEITSDTIETTAMGDASRQYIKGLHAFSGSADVYWDATHFDTSSNPDLDGLVQGAIGSAPVALVVYPEGTGANWSGNILVTGYSITAQMDGMIEASVSFQGSGPLTYATS